MRYDRYLFILLLSLMFTHCSEGGRGSGSFQGSAPATEQTTEPAPAPTTEPTATPTAEPSSIPNVSSSVFQNRSFDCLQAIFDATQLMKNTEIPAGVIADAAFANCRFIGIVVEEIVKLTQTPTGSGHVFSQQALANPLSDTFLEYREEVIKPGTDANADLSSSQRAQTDLAAKCSANEEVRVKKIGSPPGAFRVAPGGCIDDAGNQLEYAFTLVFCCPKPTTTPSTSVSTFSSQTAAQSFLGPHTPAGTWNGNVITGQNVIPDANGNPTGLSLTFVPNSGVNTVVAKLLSSKGTSDPSDDTLDSVSSGSFFSSGFQSTAPDGTMVDVSITTLPDGTRKVAVKVNRAAGSTIDKVAIIGFGADPATWEGFNTGGGTFMPSQQGIFIP